MIDCLSQTVLFSSPFNARYSCVGLLGCFAKPFQLFCCFSAKIITFTTYTPIHGRFDHNSFIVNNVPSYFSPHYDSKRMWYVILPLFSFQFGCLKSDGTSETNIFVAKFHSTFFRVFPSRRFPVSLETQPFVDFSLATSRFLAPSSSTINGLYTGDHYR